MRASGWTAVAAICAAFVACGGRKQASHDLAAPDAEPPEAGLDADMPDADSPDSTLDVGTGDTESPDAEADASDAGSDDGSFDAGPDSGPCSEPCDDSDPCTEDFCAVQTGCQHIDVSACAEPYCQSDQACGADTDHDGLSDTWESNGYVDVNCNGVDDGPEIDVPLIGAEVATPDVFVKYDWGVALDESHTHEPTAKALAQVVAAFAGHGVALHFVAGEAGIPESVVTTLDPAPDPACAGTSVATMHDLRAAHLGAWEAAYHYLFFAHRVTCPDGPHCSACPSDPACNGKPEATATGAAEILGDDAIVSFGPYIDAQQPIGVELEASTILHELGHNFGLLHGGDDSCVIGKPNYVSVMNYPYQLGGIMVSTDPGSIAQRPCVTDSDCSCSAPGGCYCTDDLVNVLGSDICYRVDYSSAELAPLNESTPSPGVGGLDELIGVGGPASSTDLILYFIPGPTQVLGPSNGSPIDWDNDGMLASHVQADIDNTGDYLLLTPFNDWAADADGFINLELRHQCTPGWGSGSSAIWATNELAPNLEWQAN